MLKQYRSFLFLCLIIPLLMGCESRKTIVSGLTEKNANEILVFLSGKGISASKVQTTESPGGGKKEVTFDIQVNSEQAAEAIALLNQAGLPRIQGQSLLGIFKESSGLVPSEMQEKIKKQAGTAEQIANTIRKIDGILDAEVLISSPEENPLSIEKTKPRVTASIFIKHNGVLDDPNSHLETKIKRLVASAVDGLDYDNVTVIGSRARYSDFPMMRPGFVSDDEKPFVSVWSIVIAKDSLTTFQIIFFSFILVLLLLVFALIWVLWKTFPLLRDHGGVKSLFQLRTDKTDKKPEEGLENTLESTSSGEGKEEKPEDEENKPPNEF